MSRISAYRILVDGEYVATWYSETGFLTVKGHLLGAKHKSIDEVLATLYPFWSTYEQDYAAFLETVTLTPLCPTSDCDDIPF